MWNHSEDPFQAAFDVCPPLSSEVVESLSRIVQVLKEEPDNVANRLREEIQGNPPFLETVLQIVGLTRNKILQDLRGIVGASSVKIPTKVTLIVRSDEVWQIAGPYLIRRLQSVLSNLTEFDNNSLQVIFNSLSQATWPGWIRQERAKRQGHEAEHRLALLFESLGIAFEPQEKAINPLCRDIQIDGESYDLVVPTAMSPLLCFKSTVHSANIGQYGESKDDLEIRNARISLQKLTPSPKLMAMIDGVGFRSNRAGLDGVLKNADEFCQFKTIWKAAVVAANAVGVKILVCLADPSAHQPFLDRFAETVQLASYDFNSQNLVPAGEANVKLLSSVESPD